MDDTKNKTKGCSIFRMNVILLGPPGAGKGSVAKKMKEIEHLTHISTGDIFRMEVDKGTELGETVKEYMKGGALVPDQYVIPMAQNLLATHSQILFDGFPRTIAQAQAIEGRVKVVIYLTAPKDLLVKRLCARRICMSTGRIYNMITRPPVEGECPEGVIQRNDDTEEVVNKRLAIYEEQTEPLVEYYKQKGKLVEIDASQPFDDVVSKVIAAIEADR